MLKIVCIIVAVIIGSFLLLEGGLQWFFGLGHPPIYIPDNDIGYLLAPDQQVRRFGKRISINRYSMRSEPVEQPRPSSTLRVFLLGDSIANGGWWTDQNETIAARVETQLKLVLKEISPNLSWQTVEVLNASANSWGPRNQLAYLKRFGTFESEAIVLLLNTDDLFATVPTALPVGRDRNYPSRQPGWAIGELLERILIPSKPIAGMEKVYGEKGDRVGINLKAIEEIITIAKSNRAEFILAITPLLREVDGTEPREYEQKARMRFKSFADAAAIPLIDFLPLFQASQAVNTLYRDRIHLTPQGNQLVSETIGHSLRKLLSSERYNPQISLE